MNFTFLQFVFTSCRIVFIRDNQSISHLIDRSINQSKRRFIWRHFNKVHRGACYEF